MNDTLSQWETELKEFLRLEGPKSFASEDGRRILALIDLVRKKDQALKKYANTVIIVDENLEVHSRSIFPEYSHAKCKIEKTLIFISMVAEKALALTEQLR